MKKHFNICIDFSGSMKKDDRYSPLQQIALNVCDYLKNAAQRQAEIAAAATAAGRDYRGDLWTSGVHYFNTEEIIPATTDETIENFLDTSKCAGSFSAVKFLKFFASGRRLEAEWNYIILISDGMTYDREDEIVAARKSLPENVTVIEININPAQRGVFPPAALKEYIKNDSELMNSFIAAIDK